MFISHIIACGYGKFPVEMLAKENCYPKETDDAIIIAETFVKNDHWKVKLYKIGDGWQTNEWNKRGAYLNLIQKILLVFQKTKAMMVVVPRNLIGLVITIQKHFISGWMRFSLKLKNLKISFTKKYLVKQKNCLIAVKIFLKKFLKILKKISESLKKNELV
jgi:hypothetical protein